MSQPIAYRLVLTTAATALAFVLAGCDGNEIPPPSPEPQVEGTVAPEEAPVTGEGFGEEPASPVEAPNGVGMSAPVEETFEDVTAEAERRAAEIFEEVTAREEDDGSTSPLDDLDIFAPDPTPLGLGEQVAPPMGALSGSLQDDTMLALQLAESGQGPAYAGVWAPRSTDCELVDQPPFTDFAVVTADTLRVDGMQCAVTPGALQSGTATVEGQCDVAGMATPASFTVSLSSSGELTVAEPALEVEGRYVRCGIQ